MTIMDYEHYIRNPHRIKFKNIAAFIYCDTIILDLTHGKRHEHVCLTDDAVFKEFKNYYVAGIRSRDNCVELAITQH